MTVIVTYWIIYSSGFVNWLFYWLPRTLYFWLIPIVGCIVKLLMCYVYIDNYFLILYKYLCTESLYSSILVRHGWPYMLHWWEDVTGRKLIVDQTSIVLHIAIHLFTLHIVYIFFYRSNYKKYADREKNIFLLSDRIKNRFLWQFVNIINEKRKKVFKFKTCLPESNFFHFLIKFFLSI